LQERRFIGVQDRGGHPSVVTVLNEMGDGTAFIPAPEAHNTLLQRKTPTGLSPNRPVVLCPPATASCSSKSRPRCGPVGWQAARVVNTELVALYWQIGRLILARQQAEGWGTRVIDRLAADLRSEFPGMRGFSHRNLVYMRTSAAAYPQMITQQPAAQLPWGHLMVLLDTVPDQQARDWYAAQALGHGWSRNVLSHHISTERYRRFGKAPNNFAGSDAGGADTDLARELVADPYDLDFPTLHPDYSERDLEGALVAQLTEFLAELGAGFSFVGRQYRLPVGDDDFFVDLLFFHLGLRCFIVFALKVSPG